MRLPEVNWWSFKMAWRDSRRIRGRLALYMSAMILGIAALVAIRSFGDSVDLTLDRQAKGLLGADLVLEKDNEPFSADAESVIDSIGGPQAREVQFASMARFPSRGRTRLVNVRAVKGPFPFYGTFQTEPASAAEAFHEGPHAVLDETLRDQYDLARGDTVTIGRYSYTIAGFLTGMSTDAGIMSSLAPRAFISRTHIDTTLLEIGSQAEYRVYFKLGADESAGELESLLRGRLDEEGDVDIDTVREERRDWGRALDNLYAFLNLVGFIAVLLGGLGVGSAIYVHLKQKTEAVATLRCMGAHPNQTLWIFLIQAGSMGLISALIGGGLGTGVQVLLPELLQPYLPVDIATQISWSAVFEGVGIGMGFAMLFALFSLLPLRRVSPLAALRVAVEKSQQRMSLGQWLVVGVLVLAVAGFAILQTDELWIALWYTGGVVGVLLLLLAVGKGLVYLARQYVPSSWPYVVRQGIANLHRPQNQTSMLMLALGLGGFLLASLSLLQTSLLGQVEATGAGGRPDLVMFDIQSRHKDSVETIIRKYPADLQQNVPIVPSRLARWKGIPVDTVIESDDREPDGWALRREYRLTYRDTLAPTETIADGEWVGEVAPGSEPVPISLETDIAGDLAVEIGDRLTFNVQGVEVEARVASLRSVEWRRVQPNFFVVFPEGVLEEAPQTYAMALSTPSSEVSADIQNAVVQRFPNVSAIDLSLIVQTAEQVLSQQAFIIRFMALFSIFTGLLVLIAALMSTRYLRLRETVLLKTLGARRGDVLWIMLSEYLSLGVLAALTGITLGIAGAWGLARFLLEIPLVVEVAPLLIILVIMVIGTLAVGVGSSWGVYQRPPMELLRLQGEGGGAAG